ncbi:MAG: isopentenyl-diphosphate Delta-isomerase [Flavobacteriales bacterium]|nr:isopentenyl-diphosphate Delta-isomerase [Flavobacteriales bacterium]
MKNADKHQFVILVNDKDEEVGTMEKLKAHRQGKLHRAFSIFLFDSEGRMLLQQRATDKYHSPRLWTNACCSHPVPGEAISDAAKRRVMQELGISPELDPQFKFTYRAELENDLVEHEIDHVFFGKWDGKVHPNPREVMDTRWLSIAELDAEIATASEKFTAWLLICWPQVRKRWAGTLPV